MIPVNQAALHDRRLWVPGGRLAGASLFPFFDDRGRVQKLMLTCEGSSSILLLDWQPRMLLRRPFLAARLRHGPEAGSEATDEAALGVADLWHFDPWWELADPRYADHPAVPWIKHTNLPGHDASIHKVLFDPALSRVVLLGVGDGGQAELKRFRPALLDAARDARAGTARPAAAPAPAGGWRLRPFWQRAGFRG